MTKKNTLILIIGIMLILGTACSSSQDKNRQEHNTEPQTDENNTDEPVYNDIAALPNEELQKGDQGEPVQLLQETLKEIGYSIQVNGQFDYETTWAITDIQLQSELVHATGIYDQETKVIIEAILSDKNKIDPGAGLPKQENIEVDDDSKLIANPYEILAIINKYNALPADYVPDDLVTPNVRFPFTEDLPKKQMRKVAAEALEEMFSAADKEGLNLFAQSGYRSYERQEAIFASNVQKNGEEAANKYSARPGESEHQSGLTMDVTSADVGFDLIIEFAETSEGKWLQEHAGEFGFIIRYPKGKEDITEYQYEPWHLRYVGKKAAIEIMSKGITLEEYLNVK